MRCGVLTAVLMEVQIILDVIHVNWQTVADISEELAASIFRPLQEDFYGEDGSSEDTDARRFIHSSDLPKRD